MIKHHLILTLMIVFCSSFCSSVFQGMNDQDPNIGCCNPTVISFTPDFCYNVEVIYGERFASFRISSTPTIQNGVPIYKGDWYTASDCSNVPDLVIEFFNNASKCGVLITPMIWYFPQIP